MEISNPNTNTKQNSITNIFLEQLETVLKEIALIINILTLYDENVNQKNFHLEEEFELTKLNSKFLEGILNCFMDFKETVVETHKIKLLKLLDFTLYDFKRLRKKYEETNEFYFNIDEEQKYIRNIKNFMEVAEMKPTKVGCLFLRLLNHYVKKISKKLKIFGENEYRISLEEKEKYAFSNNKIHFLCKAISTYLLGGEETMINTINYSQSNEMTKLVMSEFNGLSFDSNDSMKWAKFFKNLVQSIYFKIKIEKCGTKKIINTLKSGVNSFLNMIGNENNLKNNNEVFLGMMPNINIIKMLFEAFESKLISISVKEEEEKIRTNEIIYMPKKNFETYKLLNEKEGFKKNLVNKNLIKIRLLTNQIVKINFDYQNLYEVTKKPEVKKIREINFFGLLLRVSKDFLTPSYNVILHIPGGGFFSQSSESHLNYLSKWAKKTDSVIISLDYKLNSENKYPNLLDECIKAYELIVTYSAKLFNFQINKLVIYSDSVGSLIALDLIKHSIKNNLKKPDSAVFVFPCSNIIIDELSYIKDPFSFLGIEDNFLEIPIHLKLQDMFLDFNKEDENGKLYKEDDRLNFFLTDPEIVNKFPNSFILSPSNEPVQEDCQRLAKFLKLNNVDVTFKHMIYYCNDFLQLPSIFDNYYNKTLDYSLNYIIETLKPASETFNFKDDFYKYTNDRRGSTSSEETITSSIYN